MSEWTHSNEEELFSELASLAGKEELDDPYLTAPEKTETTANDYKEVKQFQIDKEALIQQEIINNEGGFVPLGFDEDKSFVWVNQKAYIECFSGSNIFSKGDLIVAFGKDWIEENYTRNILNEKGEVVKQVISYEDLGCDIVDRCISSGSFNPNKVRGSGVWVNEKDKDSLIVNNQNIWTTSKKVKTIRRIEEKDKTRYSYITHKTFDLLKDDEIATKDDVNFLKEILNTWNFKAEKDILEIIGWLTNAYICGAMHWRVHLNITGPRGSGKSQILSLFQNLFGEDYCVKLDAQTSEAGIRQALKYSSFPVMIDEAEPNRNNSKVDQIIEMFRSSSSGADVLKGTSDQNGKQYTYRFCGLVSGIYPPNLNAADTTRIIRVEMLPLEVGKALDDFLLDDVKVRAFGRKLFRRVVEMYPFFKKVYELVGKDMRAKKFENRYVDTMGLVVAGAYAVFNFDETLEEQNEVDVEDLSAFIDKFELEAKAEEILEVSDTKGLLTDILKSKLEIFLTDDDKLGNKKITDQLITCCLDAAREGEKSGYAKTLGLLGIKAEIEDGEYVIYFDQSVKNELKKILDNKYRNVDISKLLKRESINGEDKNKKEKKIGGHRCRPYKFIVDKNDWDVEELTTISQTATAYQAEQESKKNSLTSKINSSSYNNDDNECPFDNN